MAYHSDLSGVVPNIFTLFSSEASERPWTATGYKGQGVESIVDEATTRRLVLDTVGDLSYVKGSKLFGLVRLLILYLRLQVSAMRQEIYMSHSHG